jgi:hypothetical protein
MHVEQRDFFKSVRQRLPHYFTEPVVYDFGSLDINGNNRFLFVEPQYTGIDICRGQNVDVVGRAHEVVLPRLADVVISGEMLEHDRYWAQSILAMARWCRPGGLVLFSCASRGRLEHGTSRQKPDDSPMTNDYYQNLTQADVMRRIDIKALFSDFGFEYNPFPGDLYFWGIRNGMAVSDVSEAREAGRVGDLVA